MLGRVGNIYIYAEVSLHCDGLVNACAAAGFLFCV